MGQHLFRRRQEAAGMGGLRGRSWRICLPVVAAALAGAAMLVPQPDGALAQAAEPPPTPEGLKGVPVPEPAALMQYVANRDAAIRLGKALFWDMQVGSDGKTACASCHFQAGADPRVRNQVAPGLNRRSSPTTGNPDVTFQVGGPNYQFKADDFPFHKLSDPRNRNSTVLRSFNDIASSQGVFNTQFVGATPGQASDSANLLGDSVFRKDNLQTRRVEPRNAPTMINSIFYFRNFWDGRASFQFNGASPFGAMDSAARVYRGDPVNSAVAAAPVQILLENSSLASLATGPVLSDFEMSAAGRTWPWVGRRMLTARPLALQQVHSTDSMLASVRSSTGVGLNGTYMDMIRTAFRPEWWNSSVQININGQHFTQAEANFSLFFGLAIQMYGSKLVSDDSPFDRFMAGNSQAMTDEQKSGMGLFFGKGKCAECHGGAEFSNASVRKVTKGPLARMVMGNGGTAVYDEGFYNIGVTRTLDDIGHGATNPVGRPMSASALSQQVNADTFRRMVGVPLNLTPTPGERIAVNGGFKTPTIRNAELTAPYFHNGDSLTLRQVVEFYNRGGNFFNNNINDVDADIQPLNLTDLEIDQLVSFIRATTDDRVRFKRAPFDHPQLMVPNGHTVGSNGLLVAEAGRAQDTMTTIAAVGASGVTTPPLNFLEQPPAPNGNPTRFQIQLTHSGLCVWPTGGFTSAGFPLLQERCSSQAVMTWVQEPVNGGFRLRNAASGLCLAVSYGNPGDYAQTSGETCSGAAWQTFNWSNSRLVASHSGKCLGIQSGYTHSSFPFTQQTCGTFADAITRVPQ